MTAIWGTGVVNASLVLFDPMSTVDGQLLHLSDNCGQPIVDLVDQDGLTESAPDLSSEMSVVGESTIALALSELPVLGEQPAGERGPDVQSLENERLRSELARATQELAELAEHHRRELAETMAELTRLQRELRAETRAAVERLRDLARTAEADHAAPVSEASEPRPQSDSASRRFRFLRS